MAGVIALTFIFAVWAVYGALRWLLHSYFPVQLREVDQVALAALTTAMLGAIAVWLLFMLGVH